MGEEPHKWSIIVLVNELALFRCPRVLDFLQLVSPVFKLLEVFACPLQCGAHLPGSGSPASGAC